MPDLTWASHPNGVLRGYLAEYLGRGWTIESLEDDSAVLSRPKSFTRPANVLLNPFYVLYSRRKRDDEIRVSIGPAGELQETRL
jgi:hypothetical protein